MQKTFLSLLFTLAITTGFSQTEKKTWMLGGSASYSSTQEGSIHNSILDISPRIGFFIMKNLSVGAALNINTTVDDGTNTSVFSFSPFARYYFFFYL